MGCLRNGVDFGVILGLLLICNWISVGVEGSIHEYKNRVFIPYYNSFFLHGGSEHLLNDPSKNPSSDPNNPLGGKSFIRFDSISFRRTEDAANKQNEMQLSTGLVEAIVVEVKDKQKIGGTYLNSHAICCTPALAKNGTCKIGEVIIRQDPKNPDWPKRIQTSFGGTNVEASMALQTVEINKTGMYNLYFMFCNPELKGTVMNGKTVWHSQDIYLPGNIAPLMKLYGLMSLAYLVLGVFWCLRIAQHWKDVIQLHFHITGVIGVQMCNMAFWCLKYAYLCATGYQSVAITIWAVTFSVIKKTVFCLLLLVIAMGYGAMQHTLGGISIKVWLLGVVHFVAIEAINLVSQLGNFDDFSVNKRLTLLLPAAVLEVCFIIWIFTSLTKTLKKLKTRKSLATTLELYWKFTIALAISLLLSVAWIGYEVIQMHSSANEGGRYALINAEFWTFLAYFLLVVLCILWSPSINQTRYSYSEVTHVDEDP